MEAKTVEQLARIVKESSREAQAFIGKFYGEYSPAEIKIAMSCFMAGYGIGQANLLSRGTGNESNPEPV